MLIILRRVKIAGDEERDRHGFDAHHQHVAPPRGRLPIEGDGGQFRNVKGGLPAHAYTSVPIAESLCVSVRGRWVSCSGLVSRVGHSQTARTASVNPMPMGAANG